MQLWLFRGGVWLLNGKAQYCFSFAEFFEINIQRSVCVRVPFPFIAYTYDDLCRKLETIFNHSVKGAE